MAVQAGVIQTQLTADTKQFTSGMQTAQRSFQQTVSAIQGAAPRAAASVQQVGAAADQVSVAVGRLQTTFRRSMAAIGAGFILPSILGKANQAIIGFNQELDSAKISMETFLGSEEAANEMLGTLQKFAARTPFNFSDLLGTSQQMLAMGVAAEELIPRLTAVGDAAAAMGGSPEVLQRVQRALGQIQAKGRVQAEELMQLAEVGIPAYEYIAELTGGSIPQALDMMKKGQIDAASAIDALLTGMATSFGGMMEEQAKTMMGALSTVQDYVEITVGKLGRPIFEAIRDAMLKVADFLSSPSVVKAADEFATNFSDTLRNIGSVALPILKEVAMSAIEVGKALIAFGQGIYNGIQGATPVLIAVGAAFVGVAKAVELVVEMLDPIISLLAENQAVASTLVMVLGLLIIKNKLFGQSAEGVARAGTRMIASFRAVIAQMKLMAAQQQTLARYTNTSGSAFVAFGKMAATGFRAAAAAAKAFLASILPLLAVAVALEAAMSIFQAYKDRNKDLEERTQSLTDALRDNTTALLENRDALAKGVKGAEILEETLMADSDAASKLTASFGKLGKEFDIDTFVGLESDFNKQAKAMLRAAGASEEYIDSIVSAVNEVDKGSLDEVMFELTAKLGGAGVPKEVIQQYLDWAMALEELQDQVENTDLQTVVQAELDAMVGAGQLTQAMRAQAQAFADSEAAAKGLSETQRAYVLYQKAVEMASGAANRGFQIEAQQLAENEARMAAFNAQAELTAAALQKNGFGAMTVAEIYAEMAAATDDGTVKFEDFRIAVLGATSALMGLADAQKKALDESLRAADVIGNLDSTQMEFDQAVRNTVDSILELAFQTQQLGGSQTELAGSTIAMVNNLIAAGEVAGKSREEMIGLIDSLLDLDKINPVIKVALDLDLTAAIAKAQSIARDLVKGMAASADAMGAKILASPLYQAAMEVVAALQAAQGTAAASGGTWAPSPPSGGGGGGGGGAAGPTTSPLDYIANRYERGVASFREYVTALRAELTKYEEFSNEWMNIQRQIDQLMATRASDRMTKLANRYQRGDIGFAKYLKVLEKQRDQYEKFSDEWMAITDTIKQVKQDRELKRLEPIQKRINNLLDRRQKKEREIARQQQKINRILDKQAQVSRQVSDSLRDMSSVDFSTFGSAQGGLADLVNQAQQFRDAIAMLTEAGASDALIREVINRGPQEGLAMARGLLADGGANIDTLNGLVRDLNRTAKEAGTLVADTLYGEQLAAQQEALEPLLRQLEEINANIREARERRRAIRNGEDAQEASQASGGRNGGTTIVNQTFNITTNDPRRVTEAVARNGRNNGRTRTRT